MLSCVKCKKALDARKLSHRDLEILRMSAIKRVESGESPEDVAAGLGINRRGIYRWLSAYRQGGTAALKAKPVPGRPSKLTAAQEAKLTRILRDKNPVQLRFEFALWTLEMIRELLARDFKVRLSTVSVWRLVKRLGFTPQRPLYRAWQQDPALVERWRTEDFPKIAARAKREKAVIFFADESGVRSDAHSGRTWAPKGLTPVVTATGARFGFNMLSAVGARGDFRFMIVETRVNARVFRTYLQRLIKGMKRKIFLVVDGHPAHKAKLVQKFVEENSSRIELFFLPPYAPELNPDELAWAHVKSRLGRATVRTKAQLKRKALGALRRLQKLPHIVTGFFHAPTCAYAS
jgi:transposase